MEHERNSWNQASVTSGGCNSAVLDESRTTAVLAAKPLNASVHFSATGAKKRKRRKKTGRKPTAPSLTGMEGDGGAILNGSFQKASVDALKSDFSSHSQSTDQKTEPTEQTTSSSSLDLPSSSTPTLIGEKGNVEGACKGRRRKMRRQGRRRLLTVRGRFPLLLSSHNRSTRKSFHPVMFHSRADLLLHPLQLWTVREGFAFLLCLQRELTRKPTVG